MHFAILERIAFSWKSNTEAGNCGCSCETTAAESTITYYVQVGMDTGGYQECASGPIESALDSDSGAGPAMVPKSKFLFRRTLLSNPTLWLGHRIGLPDCMRVDL